MIETLIFCCVIIAVAGYFFGVSISRKSVISEQNTFIKDLRQENRDLMNKLLIRHGSSPIGIENKQREKTEEKVYPKVVTRQEMEAREPEYPRVSSEVLAKAEKIINS